MANMRNGTDKIHVNPRFMTSGIHVNPQFSNLSSYRMRPRTNFPNYSVPNNQSCSSRNQPPVYFDNVSSILQTSKAPNYYAFRNPRFEGKYPSKTIDCISSTAKCASNYYLNPKFISKNDIYHEQTFSEESAHHQKVSKIFADEASNEKQPFCSESRKSYACGIYPVRKCNNVLVNPKFLTDFSCKTDEHSALFARHKSPNSITEKENNLNSVEQRVKKYDAALSSVSVLNAESLSIVPFSKSPALERNTDKHLICKTTLSIEKEIDLLNKFHDVCTSSKLILGGNDLALCRRTFDHGNNSSELNGIPSHSKNNAALFGSKTELARNSQPQVCAKSDTFYHAPASLQYVVKTRNKLIRQKAVNPSATKYSTTFRYSAPKSPKNLYWSSRKLVKAALSVKVARNRVLCVSKSRQQKVDNAVRSNIWNRNQNTGIIGRNFVSSSQVNADITKKSDRFIRIGQSMYKATSTTLCKQSVKARSTRCERRTSTGSTMSKISKSVHEGYNNRRMSIYRRSSTGFPSLTSFIVSKPRVNLTTNSPFTSNGSYKIVRASNQAVINKASACKYTMCPIIDKKLAFAAHCEKVQALQRLIAVAKLRSVRTLRKKQCQRRCFSIAEKNSLLPFKYKTHSKEYQNDLQFSLGNASTSSESLVQSNGKVLYCRFYHRFGKCFRGDKCPFVHNPNRVAICTRFLRGRCDLKNCLFAHTIDKGRMPVCSHFLRDALCTRENCPYLHVNPNPNAPICEDFLHGHCDRMEKCKLQHVLECAEFRETGRCPRRERCPLPHPVKRLRTKSQRMRTGICEALKREVGKQAAGFKTNKRKDFNRSSKGGILGELCHSVTTKKIKVEVNGDGKKLLATRYFGTEAADDLSSNTVSRSSAYNAHSPANVPHELDTENAFNLSAHLAMKKDRIMKRLAKVKQRMSLGNVSSPSNPAYSAVLQSGKWLTSDDSEAVLVLPLSKFDTRESLPDFIPVS